MEFNSNEELEWWIYTNHLVPSDIAETNAKCQSEKYRNPKHTPSNDFKDDTRNFKGYLFEMRCKAELGNIPNVVYHGNPTAYSDWLHHHNENSFDATITYSGNDTIFFISKIQLARHIHLVRHPLRWSAFILDIRRRNAFIYSGLHYQRFFGCLMFSVFNTAS